MRMNLKAFAFFFNADHPTLGSFYGQPCTSKIIRAMEESNIDVDTYILRGSLMPHLLAYKTTTISTEKSTDAVKTISYTRSLDHELYQILLCDIAESFANGWHTIDTNKFLVNMAKKNIWTIVLPTISQQLANEIHEKNANFAPYLGATHIDTGNPMHMQIFSLVDGAYFRNGDLHFVTEEYADGLEIEEAMSRAKSYGSSKNPILIKYNEYITNAPPSLKATETTERGKLSLFRFKAKSKLSYNQKLLHAIMDFLEKNPDIEDFSYSAEISREEVFICEENKVKNYLLNISHPEGAGKAKFFIETLGIQQDDWRYLADQISGAMKFAYIYKIKNSPYGVNHGALININGRNGRTAILETGWIINSGDNAKLVTAYPYSKDIKEELQIPFENISPVELEGAELWKDIYERAHKAGINAAKECTPTPMIISGYSPIFEGACGFAWIVVKDARKGIGKWLKNNNIGYLNYKSGWAVPAEIDQIENVSWDFQSIEPKIAYADAFAKVLTSNGIECYTENQLD